MRRRQDDDEQWNANEQPPLKKKRKESIIRDEEEEFDYLIAAEKLAPDTIINILKYYKLHIGCEYERWLFLDLPYHNTSNEQLSFEVITRWLMKLLYGYFRGTSHRQYHSLYSCVSFGEMGNQLIQYIVTIKQIVCMDLKHWKSEYLDKQWTCDTKHWITNNEINGNHIEKLIVQQIESLSLQELFVSKCHNLRYLKAKTLNIPQLPNWNRLRVLIVNDECHCPVSLSQLYRQCIHLEKLHLPDETELVVCDNEFLLFSLFPNLQKLRLGLANPMYCFGSNLTSLSIGRHQLESPKLNENECTKLLTGSNLKSLHISYTDSIPASCYPYFASNTSLRKLKASGADSFWIDAWQYVIQCQSIKHLSLDNCIYSIVENIISTDHKLFEQLVSFSFGFHEALHNENMVKRLQRDGKNLKRLQISEGGINEKSFKRLHYLPKLQVLIVECRSVIEPLSSFPSTLTRLELWNYRCDTTRLVENITCIHNLKILALSVKSLSHLEMIAIFKLKTLTRLSISSEEVLEIAPSDVEICNLIKETHRLQSFVFHPISLKHYVEILNVSRHIPYVYINTDFN
jgi:hypothetical protein